MAFHVSHGSREEAADSNVSSYNTIKRQPRSTLKYSTRMTLAFALTAVMTAVVLSIVLAIVWEQQFQSYTRENMQRMVRQMAKPIPFFYFQKGAGTRDLEPYPITPVVQLLGPAVRVCSSTPFLMGERDVLVQGVGVEPRKAEVPMHSSAIIDFANGTLATVIVTDDLWTSALPGFEIYGEKGTISLYGQHKFMSPVRICTSPTGEWEEVPILQDQPFGRGLGVENMARALLYGEKLVPSGALACHVVEIMDAIAESSATGRHVAIHRTNALLG